MTHSSTLETAGQRFLSLCLQQALGDSWLSPEDFADTFSPEVVMEALEQAPTLRSRLLVEAAGVHEKIAPKKSTAAAAEDLRIALAEGVCTPSTLVDLFGMDDRVRYLKTDALWTLFTRDGFWNQASERARVRLHAIVSFALDQGLIDLGVIVDAITPARLASDLPKALLERALTRAIESGRAGAPFDPAAVFDALPLQDWVAHVPLTLLWDKVVIERVLPVTGWAAPPPPPSPEPGKDDKGKEPQASDKDKGKAKAADKPTETAPSAQAASPAQDASSEAAADSRPLHPANENEARSRAVDNLKKIDRLPPRVDELSTPLVLAIDGMYAEILTTSDEEERAELIREAFPNPAMLEEALFAVAEALDPRLNAETLRARGAEGDSLITLVLFEERRRASGRTATETRTPSRPPGPVGSPVPPGVTEGAASSLPPPLPGASQRPSAVPPPLPPGGASKRPAPPPPLPAQAGRGRGN